jgi:hypothetical protein
MTATVVEAPGAGRDDVPEVGQLVQVRGQQWVVSTVSRSRQPVDELAAAPLPGQTLVRLTSVSDDDLGEELTVVWEVEPGREIVPGDPAPGHHRYRLGRPAAAGRVPRRGALGHGRPAPTHARCRRRSGLGSALRSTSSNRWRALAMPRVNLLIADDVVLGKTIEACLVVQEMLLRHRARRVLVVCPAALTLKWRDEMAEKFGLDFRVLDTSALRELRRTHGLEANPFVVYPRVIISLQ